MSLTKLENMINPEIMADMISAELPNAIRFLPLANVDNTLVGRPGDTVTVPKFKYIGDAEDVAEGQPIDITLLTTEDSKFTIKKAGRGLELADESVLSGYGKPIEQAKEQLKMSITSKIDKDLMTALDGTSLIYKAGTAWNLDTISNAIDIFKDEDDSEMVLIMNPLDASKLRKAVAGDWDRASDLGDNIIINGTYGAVLGAQVARSKKITEGTAYLVKKGALTLFIKRKPEIETGRDIIKKTTVLTIDQHYGAHLFNESKAVKITIGAGE